MSKPRTGAPKRVAVGLLAGALAMFGVALAPSAGATTTVSTSRLAGTNRYGTAAAIAADSTFAAPATAIVATGENYPDALAASSFAGVSAPAPIVLTSTAALSDEASTALKALKGKGVTAVTIVGGTSAVTTDVENAIKALGLSTTRLAGTDRYATAAAIATAANTKSAAAPIGGLKTALIATGLNFPDALAGGPAAYRNKLPLLLVSDTIPQATSDAIKNLGIKKVEILGGTAAVSDAVKAQLDTLTGNPSDRLAGTNRFGTAAAVGNYEISTLGFAAASAVLATGNNFPDALAAGPLGGANQAPIVLTASLPAESQAFLDAHSNTINKLFVSGGTSVIDDATVSAAQAAAQNTSNDTGTNKTATTRPELVSASVVGTVSSTAGTFANPAGTTVAYTFDEPVTGAAPTAANFRLYRYSTPASPITGSSAAVSSTDTKTVNVLFSSLTTTDNNTTTGTAGITVAAVTFGAVSDVSLQGNPEGSAAVTTNGSAAVAAGVTSAPDLVSIGRFGLPTAAGTDRLVDFTFDQTAYVQSATTGFHVVLLDGSTVDCTSNPPTASTNTTNPGGGSAVGGNGTTTITVDCPAATSVTYSGQPLSSANVARGFVDRGAVGTNTLANGGGTINPIEASGSPHTATTRPDLTSVTFSPGTGTATVDTVVYTFDEAVAATLTASNFHIFQADGTQLDGTGTPARNTANNAQVSVSFTLGSLATAVGASVNAGAVTQATGSSPLPNAVDEMAATASSSTTTPGTTAGPDLTGAIISQTNNAFGQLASASVTYLFDSNITATTTASKLHLYLADGSRMTCAVALTTAANSAIPANAVTCTTAAGGYTFDTTAEGSSTRSGTNTGTATAAQVASGVAATVENGAVQDSSARPNVEGYAVTGGSTGTPTA